MIRLQTYSPKYNRWKTIYVKTIIKKWETQDFGWAIVITSKDENILVCLG